MRPGHSTIDNYAMVTAPNHAPMHCASPHIECAGTLRFRHFLTDTFQ